MNTTYTIEKNVGTDTGGKYPKQEWHNVPLKEMKEGDGVMIEAEELKGEPLAKAYRKWRGRIIILCNEQDLKPTDFSITKRNSRLYVVKRTSSPNRVTNK